MVNKKQLQIVFLATAAYNCMLTSKAVTALVFGSWGEFLGWLGPALAGWYLVFNIKRKLSVLSAGNLGG